MAVAVLTAAVSVGGELVSSSPEGASVYFIAPANGERVEALLTLKFGLEGMDVAPAGTDTPNSGHHHLLIDLDELPDLTKPLPANDQLQHFGKGQTQTEITLPPGTHTLQLLLGNYLHIPHQPPVLSEKITIIVVE